jgi:hypothetical protein
LTWHIADRAFENDPMAEPSLLWLAEMSVGQLVQLSPWLRSDVRQIKRYRSQSIALRFEIKSILRQRGEL